MAPPIPPFRPAAKRWCCFSGEKAEREQLRDTFQSIRRAFTIGGPLVV